MTIAEEYQAERERLELNRQLDWSSYSKDYVVAGETLLPMTVQNWFDLLAIKSPLLYSDEPTVASIVDYVWKNCKRFTQNNIIAQWRLFWIQRRIIKSLRHKQEGPALIVVLTEHIKSSLDEFPIDANGSSSGKTNKIAPVSGEASMIDELATRYSMNPEDVLKMPLRRAFSLQRTIRLSTIPGYKLLEADSIRAIKSKYLQSLNNGT
jgi:hypothetical protein